MAYIKLHAANDESSCRVSTTKEWWLTSALIGWSTYSNLQDGEYTELRWWYDSPRTGGVLFVIDCISMYPHLTRLTLSFSHEPTDWSTHWRTTPYPLHRQRWSYYVVRTYSTNEGSKSQKTITFSSCPTIGLPTRVATSGIALRYVSTGIAILIASRHLFCPDDALRSNFQANSVIRPEHSSTSPGLVQSVRALFTQLFSLQEYWSDHWPLTADMEHY